MTWDINNTTAHTLCVYTSCEKQDGTSHTESYSLDPQETRKIEVDTQIFCTMHIHSDIGSHAFVFHKSELMESSHFGNLAVSIGTAVRTITCK